MQENVWNEDYEEIKRQKARAFVIDESKVQDFFDRKRPTSIDAINRVERRKKKDFSEFMVPEHNQEINKNYPMFLTL